jgi:post-segregation antitoxin (ccd killing protein)
MTRQSAISSHTFVLSDKAAKIRIRWGCFRPRWPTDLACERKCVIAIVTMKPRTGKTATFSISVDVATQRILKEEAKRSYGGNVSALVSAIAKEAKRQASLDWLLQGATSVTTAERHVFLAEIDGPIKRRRKAA